MTTNENRNPKMDFPALLAILFIGLKLCGIIAWSWWLVLLPLYVGLLGTLCLGAIGVGVGTLFTRK